MLNIDVGLLQCLLYLGQKVLDCLGQKYFLKPDLDFAVGGGSQAGEGGHAVLAHQPLGQAAVAAKVGQRCRRRLLQLRVRRRLPARTRCVCTAKAGTSIMTSVIAEAAKVSHKCQVSNWALQSFLMMSVIAKAAN